jgi:putative colanic acid biosynthesis UDP-glucose lipid carrier transferase
MTEKYGTYYTLMGALVDLALINMSGYLAYLLVYWPAAFEDHHGLSILQVVLINVIWFNVTQISKLYRNMLTKEAIPTIREALYSLVLFAVFMSCLAFFMPEFRVSRMLIFYTILIFAPAFLIGKLCFLMLRRKHRLHLTEYKRVVIVGAGPVGLELSRIMESSPAMGFRVVGFFDDLPGYKLQGALILGKVSDCIAFVKQYHINEIYCALPDRAIHTINELMRIADQEMIRVKVVPDVKDYFKKNVNVKMLGHFPVISPRTEPLEILSNQLFKRVFDVLVSSFVIIFIMSWVVPLFAFLIKLESKGPVFFRQQRSGKDNKPFNCLKFRSMKVNGDADQKQACKNDNRITSVGAFMRKTSIDELPQFFNVLMNEMSIVGPRPHMIQHTTAYSASIDNYMVRHFLLPGITGWAQVNGFRGETNEAGAMEARVKADLWYLENWSMFLDFKIVFLTGWKVFAGDENAY